MRGQKRIWWTGVVGVCIGMGGTFPSRADDQPSLKHRIAVMNFEDKSQGSHRGWRTVGEGMADMFVTALVKSNKFTVVEREQITKVREEQKLGMSGDVTAQSAAKVGQIVGVGYIITGSVSEFGVKDSKLEVGGFGLPFGGGVKTNTARVVADIRLVNTSTAVIEKAEKGEGEESSHGVEVDVHGAPKVEFGKEGFDETVIGKAVKKSIDQLVEKLVNRMKSLPWQGRIIKVDDKAKKLYINSGKLDGQRVGKTYLVYRKGEDLIDPDSGESLGSEMIKVGKVKIMTLQDRFSIASIEEGDGLTKDDVVKSE